VERCFGDEIFLWGGFIRYHYRTIYRFPDSCICDVTTQPSDYLAKIPIHTSSYMYLFTILSIRFTKTSGDGILDRDGGECVYREKIWRGRHNHWILITGFFQARKKRKQSISWIWKEGKGGAKDIFQSFTFLLFSFYLTALMTAVCILPSSSPICHFSFFAISNSGSESPNRDHVVDGNYF